MRSCTARRQRGGAGHQQPRPAQRRRDRRVLLGLGGEPVVHGRHAEQHRRAARQRLGRAPGEKRPRWCTVPPRRSGRGCRARARARGTAAARGRARRRPSTATRPRARRGSWRWPGAGARRPWAGRSCPTCRRRARAPRRPGSPRGGSARARPRRRRARGRRRRRPAAGARRREEQRRALSARMCASSRSPAFGFTGTTGTPASSAPTTATQVSSSARPRPRPRRARGALGHGARRAGELGVGQRARAEADASRSPPAAAGPAAAPWRCGHRERSSWSPPACASASAADHGGARRRAACGKPAERGRGAASGCGRRVARDCDRRCAIIAARFAAAGRMTRAHSPIPDRLGDHRSLAARVAGRRQAVAHRRAGVPRGAPAPDDRPRRRDGVLRRPHARALDGRRRLRARAVGARGRQRGTVAEAENAAVHRRARADGPAAGGQGHHAVHPRAARPAARRRGARRPDPRLVAVEPPVHVDLARARLRLRRARPARRRWCSASSRSPSRWARSSSCR